MARKGEIKVGDIVTVTSNKSCYEGKQGKVAEIVADGDKDGPIGVQFHRFDMMHYVKNDQECIVRHEERELRIDRTWDVVTRAKQVYAGNYHSVRSIPFEFDARNPCMHEGCSCNSVRRCVINIWGTVCEADLCEPHAKEADGMMAEEFPWKKDYKPVVATKKAA